MCWDSRGTLFYSSRNIWMLPSGGKPVSITTRGDGERVHALPSLLPGNQVLVFTIRRGWFCWGDEDVVAYSLATKTRTRLLTNAADARYVSTGHLLFMRLGVLYAVRFDPERLAVEGPETPVSEDIAQALASWNADDATGADQYGDTFRDILVGSIDGGKARLAPLLRSTYSEEYPEFSPDGHWLIYASDVSGRRELYVRPWAGQGPAIPVSVGGGSQPAWHPNGREIFFVGPTDTPGRTRMLAVGFTPGTPPRVDRGFDD
jgi:Tol biopolymer transport system component